MLKPRTGAEKYFADRMLDPEYLSAYKGAVIGVSSVDAAAQPLDAVSEVLETE